MKSSLWRYKDLASAAHAARTPPALTSVDEQFFTEEQARHEAAYLAGTNPRQQSGFGRDARDWERFRRVVVAPIDRDASFLDIGCANGLLMESVVEWARENGHVVEPSGLEISDKLANLARQRLPHWRDRIFVGNPLLGSTSTVRLCPNRARVRAARASAGVSRAPVRAPCGSRRMSACVRVR
jgi:hypothetical protein